MAYSESHLPKCYLYKISMAVKLDFCQIRARENRRAAFIPGTRRQAGGHTSLVSRGVECLVHP
jgi:ribosomal protein S26